MNKATLFFKIAGRTTFGIFLVLITFITTYFISGVIAIGAITEVVEIDLGMTSNSAFNYVITTKEISYILTTSALSLSILPTVVMAIVQLVIINEYKSELTSPSPTPLSRAAICEEIKRRNAERDELEYQQVLEKMPYTGKGLLTKPEKELWRILKKYIPEWQYVIAKPCLKEFISTPNYKYSHIDKRAWREIAQKHVDFLVCSAYSLNPLFAIEYDGSTHDPDNPNNSSTVRSDEFKNKLFKQIRIPLIRIDYNSGYFLEAEVESSIMKMQDKFTYKFTFQLLLQPLNSREDRSSRFTSCQTE